MIDARELPTTLKDMGTRYRCTACGNLTRFDVVETTSVRSFHHYTVGGDLTIEEPEVISRSIDSVTCRWCGHGRDVEVVTESA
ncbi:MAG: hypothetical protein ABSG09_01275 [Acidimicrobiales bacterium]|jgi:hypothetical protein